MTTLTAPFSTGAFRDALGAFPTGVTVVTTQGTGHPYGMTANSFASVSLQPPLVLICVMDGTEGARTIRENATFTVNVLSDEQEAVARYFASHERPRDAAMFEQVSHTRPASGAPVLHGIAAHFDCTLQSAFEAGDHVVFIGQVVHLSVHREKRPLLFFHGRYEAIQGNVVARHANRGAAED